MKAAAQERRPTERLGFNPNTTESTEHRPSPKSFHHTNPQKEESEKVGLKLNNEKTKIMASDPITSWEIDGETVETVSDFIFLGSKITADGDCSYEIKRRLLLGRKVMTNLDKAYSKTETNKVPPYLTNKGLSSQGYGFSSSHVWM